MYEVINIYFTPEVESAASEQEVADYIGISLQTLRDRLVRFGIDHYLTYYPGNIPSRVRRFAKRGGKDSRLKEIKKEVREPMDSISAQGLVIGLIRLSQKHYLANGCRESKAFLLNEGGMLEWYLEAYPMINQKELLRRMREWVRSH